MNTADDPWRAALTELVALTRLAQADELAPAADAAVAPLGLSAWMYLVDQEQRLLRPVPRPGAGSPAEQAVDGTVAGQSFTTVRIVPAPGRLWIPLLDGTERLGVLELVGATRRQLGDAGFRSGCELYAQLLGHLVATKVPYGDALLQVRRRHRMSAASELLWRMLPPLTFACERAVVAAILEPCYEVGGDGFDYAADGRTLFFAIFDTAGHELRAGLGTATVMSAIRAARRDGDDLAGMVRAADRALEQHLPELRFTTAILAQLDLADGRLRYVNAGHPPALLIRRGRVVRSLDGGRRMPLGVDDDQLEIGAETLERGDRLLLYTDGVTDARDPSGEPFGADRLGGLAGQKAFELPAPEALRRLCHEALAHYAGPPADDATLLLVEWADDAVRAMRPD